VEVQLYAKHFGTPRVRGDVWSATVAHSAAQPHIRKKLTPADFIPSWGKVAKRETAKDMAAKARAWVAMAARSRKGE
jgi:hypothetical protein